MKFAPHIPPFYLLACSLFPLTSSVLADTSSTGNASAASPAIEVPGAPGSSAGATSSGTAPSATSPDASSPASPSNRESRDSSPADSSPADSSPADSSPADSSPADSSPADSSPADASTSAPTFSGLTFATAPALTDTRLVKRVVLKNGASLVMQPDRTSPRVAFSVLVRAGAADETPQSAGWRRLLAEASLRATQQNGETQSFAALNRQAEELGGRLGASVNDDAIEFSVTGESANANALLDLLLRALRSPRLSDDDVQVARQLLTARRDAISDDITTIAINALGAQLFQDAAGQPLAYGLPTLGTSASLNALSAPQLRALRSRFFQTNRVTIGVTGDLDEVNLRSRLEALSFPAISNVAANPVLDVAPMFAPRSPSKPVVIPQLSVIPGDWVFVSYRLGAAQSDDTPALSVLVAALGASPGARLSKQLLTSSTGIEKVAPQTQTQTPQAQTPQAQTRITRPLAQQASAALTPRRFGGDLTVFALTGSGTAEQLRQTIVDEAKRLRETPLDERELSAARRYAIGDWMTSGEALHDRALRLASDELLGVAQTNTMWPVRLQNVTADDIQRAARLYLNNETIVVIHAAS